MKRDDRSFEHVTLESIDLMAVERVRDAECPSSVIGSFGSDHTTVCRWLNAAGWPGAGVTALRSNPVIGRPRGLPPRQSQQC
jgi:hypothetical protein